VLFALASRAGHVQIVNAEDELEAAEGRVDELDVDAGFTELAGDGGHPVRTVLDLDHDLPLPLRARRRSASSSCCRHPLVVRSRSA
jgi:hypothetical protein